MRIRMQHLSCCFASLTLLMAEGFCGPAFESPLAEFQGQVVDAETSEPVTDFWVQLGTANPRKPDEISWSQEFHGPVLGKPGFFSLQSLKKWKTWARVVADGYLPQPVTAEPLVSPFRVAHLTVRLKRGGELRGILRDHAGRAAAGARVLLATEQNLNLEDGNPNSTFRGSSAITDAEGRFALRGVGRGKQKIVVVSADGLPVWIAGKTEPGQELKITLPEPATLIIRYDITDDVPQTKLQLQLKTKDMPGWKGGAFLRQPTVTNRGEVVVAGLPGGTYDLARTKLLRVGTKALVAAYGRSTVVLQAGQTHHVDFLRATGFPVRGRIAGLAKAKVPGAFIYVRSAEASGDPSKIEEWFLPLFEAMTCDEAGYFSTARLEPGAYTFVAEAFLPETSSQAFRTGLHLPDYIGTAKVTVSATAPPAPVTIDLSQRPSTK